MVALNLGRLGDFGERSPIVRVETITGNAKDQIRQEP